MTKTEASMVQVQPSLQMNPDRLASIMGYNEEREARLKIITTLDIETIEKLAEACVEECATLAREYMLYKEAHRRKSAEMSTDSSQ